VGALVGDPTLGLLVGALFAMVVALMNAPGI